MYLISCKSVPREIGPTLNNNNWAIIGKRNFKIDATLVVYDKPALEMQAIYHLKNQFTSSYVISERCTYDLVYANYVLYEYVYLSRFNLIASTPHNIVYMKLIQSTIKKLFGRFVRLQWVLIPFLASPFCLWRKGMTCTKAIWAARLIDWCTKFPISRTISITRLRFFNAVCWTQRLQN